MSGDPFEVRARNLLNTWNNSIFHRLNWNIEELVPLLADALQDARDIKWPDEEKEIRKVTFLRKMEGK